MFLHIIFALLIPLITTQVVVDYPLPIVAGTYNRQVCSCDQGANCASIFALIYQVQQTDGSISMLPGSWTGTLEESRDVSLFESGSGNNCTGIFDEQLGEFVLDCFVPSESQNCNLSLSCGDRQMCRCEIDDSFTIDMNDRIRVGYCTNVLQGGFIGAIPSLSDPMISESSSSDQQYQVFIFNEMEEENFLNSQPFNCLNGDCLTIINDEDYNSVQRSPVTEAYSVYIECVQERSPGTGCRLSVSISFRVEDFCSTCPRVNFNGDTETYICPTCTTGTFDDGLGNCFCDPSLVTPCFNCTENPMQNMTISSTTEMTSTTDDTSSTESSSTSMETSSASTITSSTFTTMIPTSSQTITETTSEIVDMTMGDSSTEIIEESGTSKRNYHVLLYLVILIFIFTLLNP